jgi:hypothetical protein
MLEYNSVKNSGRIIRLGTENNGYSGISVKDNKIYLSPRNQNGYGTSYCIDSGEVIRLPRSSTSTVGLTIIGDKPHYFIDYDYLFVRSIRQGYISYNNREKCIEIRDDNGIKKIDNQVRIDLSSLGTITEGEFMKLSEFVKEV